MPHTNNKEERIEEVVNRLFDLTVDCKLVPQDIRDAFHQELQKARESEREKIGNLMLTQLDKSTKIKALKSISDSFRAMVIKAITQSELDQPNQTVSIYRINIGKGKNIIKDIEFETTVPGTVEVIFTPDN